MTFLDETSALTNAGSLLSRDGEIVASYDLEIANVAAEGYRALSVVPAIKNANVAPLEADYSRLTRVHVINGMGVTLGDSIIGLTALALIKKMHPGLSFVIYRPGHAPAYVRQLYELATPIFGPVVNLPVDIDSLPDDELRIDLGNHLFWPNFSSMPMIDFFLWALGIAPDDVSPKDKSNGWLKQIELPVSRTEWSGKEYTLFCPTASTPVRSIPHSFRAEAVNWLWQRFHLPVLGFGKVDHQHYTDISSLSTDTAAFFAWVKNAHCLVTSDTAAVHIAAGFDVPTVAFFTTIQSDLRVRDYESCAAINLPLPEIQGIQASAREGDLGIVDRAYQKLIVDDWTLQLRG
ncbi:glycosyltransferase family 9 protein [Paraburkholderia ginsengisoli]|uniref:ADP-heptose--LPS heptosyltransferase n=1 Tax=Paraburkholderia ginsengisoli TaxID=311231 RepID=A0A7T4N9R9_9BURK|nr:ADP-heptose--LPS heptosyltransferase [Paraburkholderia ginsengisoli]QQC67866.1 ADP-heptose--LPS heptosyltransferase [Paraburkholderia ginsengisoli]